MDVGYLRRHASSIAFALLIIIVLLAAAKLWLLDPLRSVDPWRGCDVYLLEKGGDAPPEEAAAVLREASYREIIRRGTQRVEMFTYHGIEEFRYAALDGHFLPQDPLRDPYVEGLGAYFNGEIDGRDAHVIYALGGDLNLGEWLQLRSELDRLGVRWARPGAGPYAAVLLLGAGAAFLLLLSIGVAGRHSLFFLFGALPFAAGIQYPGYSYTVAVLIVSFGFALLLRTGLPMVRRRLNDPGGSAGWVRVLPPAAYLLSGAAALCYPTLDPHGNPAVGGHLLLGIGMQAAVGGLAVYREYRRYIGQQHRLFYPVTLGTGRSRGNSGRTLVKGAAPALLLLLVLPFGFELLDGRAQEVRMPVPEYLSAESRGELDFSSLSSAASRRRPGSTDGTEELPTLVDYVAHMAYQEGYLYGRDYGFPSPGERITLPRYDGTGMEVQRREKVVKLFTDEWYEDIISQARLDGIEGLLYEQRAPVRVSSSLIESLRVTGEVKRGHVVFTAVLSLFLFLTAGRNPQRSYAPGVRQGTRERRKVA